MFRKTTPNPAVRFPSPEPKPLPRSEGKELMYRVLTRINSLDDSDLDPWEVALKSLRRMTMLRSQEPMGCSPDQGGSATPPGSDSHPGVKPRHSGGADS